MVESYSPTVIHHFEKKMRNIYFNWEGGDECPIAGFFKMAIKVK